MSLIEQVGWTQTHEPDFLGNIVDQHGNITKRKETGKISKEGISSQFKGKHISFAREKEYKKMKRRLKDNKEQLAGTIRVGIMLRADRSPSRSQRDKFDIERELWIKDLRKKIKKKEAWIRMNPRDITRLRQLKEEIKELEKMTKDLKKTGGLKKNVSKEEFEQSRIKLKQMIGK